MKGVMLWKCRMVLLKLLFFLFIVMLVFCLVFCKWNVWLWDYKFFFFWVLFFICERVLLIKVFWVFVWDCRLKDCNMILLSMFFVWVLNFIIFVVVFLVVWWIILVRIFCLMLKFNWKILLCFFLILSFLKNCLVIVVNLCLDVFLGFFWIIKFKILLIYDCINLWIK